ncbi:hypothetical protein BV20DRAFT_872198 [Pilatotrama ljubarskyi]|nr:hypothetical protein BV20DRAFT_872198 [Pilatotrama ljubarskyi]
MTQTSITRTLPPFVAAPQLLTESVRWLTLACAREGRQRRQSRTLKEDAPMSVPASSTTSSRGNLGTIRFSACAPGVVERQRGAGQGAMDELYGAGLTTGVGAPDVRPLPLPVPGQGRRPGRRFKYVTVLMEVGDNDENDGASVGGEDVDGFHEEPPPYEPRPDDR